MVSGGVREGRGREFTPKKTLKGSEGLGMMPQLADILGPIRASLPDPLPASQIRCDTVYVSPQTSSARLTCILDPRSQSGRHTVDVVMMAWWRVHSRNTG